MYLWLIIATFITAIFALSSPVRHDIKQLYVEPQAENVMTKLYVQHRAAVKQRTDHRLDGPGKRPSYKPGVVTEEELRGYVPYGFNYDSGVTRFTTLTYCLDEKSEGVSQLPQDCFVIPEEGEEGEEGAPEIVANCCAGTNARTYVITFGCVPTKWQDVRTGKPSGDLLGVMKSTLGFTNGLGYIIKRSEIDLPEEGTAGEAVMGHVSLEPIKTTMGIKGQGNRYYIPIPQYIISNMLSEAGKSSFNNVCGDSRKQKNYNPEDDDETPSSALNYYGSCDYCLVYMTPF